LYFEGIVTMTLTAGLLIGCLITKMTFNDSYLRFQVQRKPYLMLLNAPNRVLRQQEKTGSHLPRHTT
jgi:hypothetical protein